MGKHEEASEDEVRFSLLVCVLAMAACTPPPPVAKSEGAGRERPFSKTEIFDLRSKCSALANSFEDRHPKSAKGSVDFTNHYNEADNRCYVEITGIAQGFSKREVYDGQEEHIIVSCNQQLGKSFGNPICFDDHGQAIGIVVANQTANKLMAEEVGWGLPVGPRAGE